MVRSRETELYRQDVRAKGTFISPSERERLLRPYLPPPPKDDAPRRKVSQPIQDFFMKQVHIFIFSIIHILFSVYIRIRQTHHAIMDKIFAVLYYHHRAPELIKQDVKTLDRLPQHLSVILELKSDDRGTASLEALMDDVAEIAAWCSCVGIPILSVYEKSGKCIASLFGSWLKPFRYTQRLRSHNSSSDFEKDACLLWEAHTHYPIAGSSHAICHERRQTRGRCNGYCICKSVALDPSCHNHCADRVSLGHLSILLISAEDGRSTMVDLTKTLTEMSQRKKVAPDDISQDLIDAEISESVMSEPDLLVLFGPSVHLQGYPPWQARLTEIFHVQGNSGVGYQVFLRALYRYANAQMKFGR